MARKLRGAKQTVKQATPKQPAPKSIAAAAAELDSSPARNQAADQASAELAAGGDAADEAGPADACRQCGSTDGTYKQTSALPIVGVDDTTGRPFDWIVWGVVVCAGCGQRRARRRYELRGAEA